MGILQSKVIVKPAVPTGNYEMKLVKKEEIKNDKGGYVQLTFKDDKYEIVHNIFGSNQSQIDYTVQTLARQLEKDGNLSLDEVLELNRTYKLYVSYNNFGRNVAFGVRNEEAVVEEDLALS